MTAEELYQASPIRRRHRSTKAEVEALKVAEVSEREIISKLVGGP